MTTRARSRLAALALAGLLALVPVTGSILLAPAAAADDQAVVCLTEEQAADPQIACIEHRDEEGNLVEPLVPDEDDVDNSGLARDGIEPVPADLDAEEDGTTGEDEVDYLGSLMLFAATSIVSLGTIGMAAYFLFFKKQQTRKNAV